MSPRKHGTAGARGAAAAPPGTPGNTHHGAGAPARPAGGVGAAGLGAVSTPVRVALLALMLAAAYAGALRAGVAWDDAGLISGNPAIRSLDHPWRFFTDRETLVPQGGVLWSQYRPLRTLLFALEFAVFGGGAWGFHLVSLLLHALSAFLVGRLAEALFARGGWLAATVWLLHPAVSENALYLAAQGNLLCLVFSLLAVLAHLRWLDTGATRWQAGALAAFLLALGAYESAAMLPVLLALVEFVRRRRGGSFAAGVVRRHLPYWLVLGLFLAVRHAVVLTVPREPWWGGNWPAAVGLQLRVWVEAWRLSLLPLTQKVRYLPADIPAFATPWVAVALHVALAALAVRALRTGRGAVAAACVAWWYVAQAPTSNLLVTNLGYMFAPRFLFLALALPVAAFAAWLESVRPRSAIALALAAAALVAVALDRGRVEVWQNQLSLYRAMLEDNPDDADARYNLGWSLLLTGDVAGAQRELEAAKALNPAWPPTAFLLGELRARAGDFQGAHGEYNVVIRARPASAVPRLRLAEVALCARQWQASRDWLATVGPFDSSGPYTRARLELTRARLEMAHRDPSRVEARVERALAAWPGAADVVFESGVLLFYLGDREHGRGLLVRAAELAGREYHDMVGDAAWLDTASLRPLIQLTPPRIFASFTVPWVGP